MSPEVGTKRTCRSILAMSVVGGKAENICAHGAFPVLTRSGPRSEIEVGLVRASLLAHGNRRGLETTRDRPLMSRGRQQVPARDHLAPGIDALSQGRHYRGGASYARLRSVARGPPGDRARIPLGSDGSRAE